MVSELKLVSPSKTDLLPQALQFFDDYTFRGPAEKEKREISSMGYDIFIAIDGRSLPKILVANRVYFQPRLLGFLNNRPELAKYVPPSMVVGLRSEEPFLRDSFNKSQNELLKMHLKESEIVQKLVSGARHTMLPAAAVALLAQEYLQIRNQLLFTDRYTWALDVTAITKSVCIDPKNGTISQEAECVYAADIGRSRPEFKLDVGEWPRGGSRENLGSLSAIVFIDEMINPLAL